MRPLRALAGVASELRVPLSMVLKSELGREVLRSTSGVAGLVLQGGGAVHHVFGSPRFSADLDFAQQADLDEARLSAGLADAALVAQAAWGACSVEAVTTKGRLHRQKLRVSLAEIIADKVVAAVDRLASRGMMKLRDVFDIRFLFDFGRPRRDLVLAKLADYGYPQDLAPLRSLAVVLDEVAAERLRGELRDVLPRPDLERFDPVAAVAMVRSFYLELSA